MQIASPRALSPAQRALGQRYALLANLFLMVSQFIVQGVIMMLYANDVLGFTPQRIAYILGAMPLLGLLRLAFLQQIRAIGKRRLLTTSVSIRIGCTLTLAAIPATYLSFPLFLGILLVYALTDQIGAGAVWQPLMREITTPEDRGRFFARMRFSFTAVSAVVALCLPLLIGSQITELQFKLLLLLATAGQLNNLFWVRRIPEVQHRDDTTRSRSQFAKTIQALKTSPLLRTPLVIACIFGFMALPLYPIYLKQMIHAPSDIVSWILFAATVGGGISLLLWGHVADQIGFKPMLKGLLLLAMLILPTHLLIAPFDTLPEYTTRELLTITILLTHGFIGGILGAGTGIAMTSIQHTFVQHDDSIEAMNLYQGATMLLAALITAGAGYLLQHIAIPLGIHSTPNGWLSIDVIRSYMLTAGLFGPLLALKALRKIPNTRPYFAVTDFFAALSGNPLRITFAQRNLYHEDEDTRLRTALWLGKQSSPLILDLLAKFLDDPSYDVRVTAIRALAGTQSELAGEKLLAMLCDPTRQSVADHVAWSLGELGYQPAAEALIAHLASPYAVRTRAMSARALGKLGCTDAVEPIAELLCDDTLKLSQHLVSSACRALLRIGSTDHIARIFSMLNGLSAREDRYELMDVLCLYLDIPNEWVLKAYSTTSPREALLDHIAYKSRRWHQCHADLINHVREQHLIPVQCELALAAEATPENLVLNGLKEALEQTDTWGPLAVLASAHLMLSPTKP